MSEHKDDTALESLVGALMGWAGQGALIIDHMARWEKRVSVELNSYDSLTTILCSALTELEERHAADDLATAAGVLADVVDTIGREVLLVDMPADLNGEM